MIKLSKEVRRKINEARQPKLIEENEMYKIEIIPLNYRMTIKLPIRKCHEYRKLERDYYADLDAGLDYARESVMATIDRFFVKPDDKDYKVLEKANREMGDKLRRANAGRIKVLQSTIAC